MFFNRQDQNEYIKKLSDFFHRPTQEIIENIKNPRLNNNNTENLLYWELKKVIKGDAPLIEFEICADIISKQYYLIDFDNYIKDTKLIEDYLEQWLKNFRHPISGYIILKLLSSNQSYTINDILIAMFDKDFSNSKEDIQKLEYILNENIFIKTSYQNGNIKRFSSRHNYVCRVLDEFCKMKEIPKKIIDYIDYCKEIMEKKHISDIYENIINEITSNFNRFNSPSKFTLINVIITIIVIFFVCLSSTKQDISLRYKYIANVVMSAPSALYMYNYCEDL